MTINKTELLARLSLLQSVEDVDRPMFTAAEVNMLLATEAWEPNGLKETPAQRAEFAAENVVVNCEECGQPMKPHGVVKLPNEYDHAHGCPNVRVQPPSCQH